MNSTIPAEFRSRIARLDALQLFNLFDAYSAAAKALHGACFYACIEDSPADNLLREEMAALIDKANAIADRMERRFPSDDSAAEVLLRRALNDGAPIGQIASVASRLARLQARA